MVCYNKTLNNQFKAGMSTLWLPSVAFGSMTLLSALIVMTLPDTTNRELQLTVENYNIDEE